MSLSFLMVNPAAERRIHNLAVLSECKEGDLLEFERTGYTHWAVYVGNQRVIHRTEDKDNKTVKVLEDRFWDIVENKTVEINNYLDKLKDPLPGWQIVQRARSKLGETGYSAMLKNCEHFATWCRYGRGFSRQALKVATASAALTTLGVATGNPVLASASLGLGGLTAVVSKGSKKSLN